MIFRQEIDHCFAEKVGEGGLPHAEFDQLQHRAAEVIEGFKAKPDHQTKALLALPSRRDDLAELADLAERWRDKFNRIYLLGIGGSALGARALVAALGNKMDAPKLIILDNLDAATAQQLADPEIAADSAFLVISKSGGTDETLSQALIAATSATKAHGAEVMAERFLMIADPGDRPLRRLADHLGATVLDHDPLIDGRFSVLSPVGLLPAMMLGLDVFAIRAGAEAVLTENLAAAIGRPGPAAQGAALAVGLNASRGVSQTILLCYEERLRTFALWYRQLWAESLGKSGKGTTPIDALGPIDQHSQLQLYLDGPWDKMFTLVTLPQRGKGPVIDADLSRSIGMAHIAGHQVGDLVAAMQRATADCLAEQGRPVRNMLLERLDAEAMGALFMHFFLETLIAAALFRVEPFGQPAVDHGKTLARRYLTEFSGGNGASETAE